MKKEKVTINTIAEEAGVSPSTVSRVLNKPNLVQEKTRSAVNAALKKFNYVPQTVHKEREDDVRQYTIGLAIHNPKLEVVSDLIREIETKLDLLGGQSDLLIINMRGEKNLGKFFREHAFYRHKIDALIAFSVSLNLEDAHYIQAQNIPVVMLHSRCIGAKSISTNNFQGAVDAVTYLFSRGYERIGFVGWDVKDNRLLDRYAGYVEALNRQGKKIEENHVAHDELSVNGGYEATKRLLADADLDAIFFACDSMAVGGMKYCNEHSIAIADELGIVGFDGLELAEVMGLTTMNQFIDVKAEMSISYLMQYIKGEILEPQINELFITPRIVVRSTTK